MVDTSSFSLLAALMNVSSVLGLFARDGGGVLIHKAAIHSYTLSLRYSSGSS